MRRALVVIPVAALLAGCGGGSSPSASTTVPGSATTTSAQSPRPFPSFVLPTPSINPCKLTAAQISAVVGFAVAKQKQTSPDQCEYRKAEGGSVWFRVDAFSNLNAKADKSNESFSLGGRYITITDEPSFPHGGFTAVKNPGDKSPGVIADAVAYLSPPGHLVLRIYYPSGGHEPGRAHALELVRLMLA